MATTWQGLAARPRLSLLCGLPGAGKTTLAWRMEHELPVVRVCPDEWMVDLGIDHGDATTHDRLEARLSHLAMELLRRGQRREEAREAGVPTDLYYLSAPVAELWHRLAMRNQQS